MGSINKIIATPNPVLYIASSAIHGRGVFSSRVIKPGILIETCPIIKMTYDEMHVFRPMVLNYYSFMLDEEMKNCGVVLGYGSLYNHSENNNAIYYYDPAKELMVFEARYRIAKHEEITINYLGENAEGETIDTWFRKPEI